MKKLIITCAALFLAIASAAPLTSCSKDDENTSSQNASLIAGTSWQNFQLGITVAFINNSQVSLIEPGEPTFNGTYTFSNNSGIINTGEMVISFTISGNTMNLTLKGTTITLNKV